jgi:uncharacterized repeat protein (TIGR03803 family)
MDALTTLSLAFFRTNAPNSSAHTRSPLVRPAPRVACIIILMLALVLVAAPSHATSDAVINMYPTSYGATGTTVEIDAVYTWYTSDSNPFDGANYTVANAKGKIVQSGDIPEGTPVETGTLMTMNCIVYVDLPPNPTKLEAVYTLRAHAYEEDGASASEVASEAVAADNIPPTIVSSSGPLFSVDPEPWSYGGYAIVTDSNAGLGTLGEFALRDSDGNLVDPWGSATFYLESDGLEYATNPLGMSGMPVPGNKSKTKDAIYVLELMVEDGVGVQWELPVATWTIGPDADPPTFDAEPASRHLPAYGGSVSESAIFTAGSCGYITAASFELVNSDKAVLSTAVCQNGITVSGGEIYSTDDLTVPQNSSTADVEYTVRVVSTDACGDTWIDTNFQRVTVKANQVESLTPSLSTVNPGRQVIMSVSLFAPALAAGLTVAISSNSPEVVVPASVVVSAGQTAAQFSAQVSPAAPVGSYIVTADPGAARATVRVKESVAGGAVDSLYSFSALTQNGINSDGANPDSSLIEDAKGNFFGTALGGGVNGDGTVFEINGSGEFSMIAAFAGSNGSQPYAGLIQYSDGNLYGTTVTGGADLDGTVFQVTEGGSITNLASFDGGNGANPLASLVLGEDGNFYGTTQAGGANGDGAVFYVTPAGDLTAVASFNGTDGAQPYGSLIAGSNGVFLGTASVGGANNGGAVFSFTSVGGLSLLDSFPLSGDSDSEGSNPTSGLTLGSDGDYYGTTNTGGAYDYGTIFKVTASGSLQTICSFDGENGAYPYSGVTEGPDGDFYGAAPEGGANNDGVVFQLTPAGKLTAIVSFEGGNGAFPLGALTLGADGSLYGTTQQGGANGTGTVFKVTGF